MTTIALEKRIREQEFYFDQGAIFRTVVIWLKEDTSGNNKKTYFNR